MSFQSGQSYWVCSECNNFKLQRILDNDRSKDLFIQKVVLPENLSARQFSHTLCIYIVTLLKYHFKFKEEELVQAFVGRLW